MRTRKAPRINRAARQSGFSLIELMIALVAGLIVSAALVAFTMSSFRSNGEYVLSTRLTQELRNSLDLVMRDLRRAGYDEGALGRLAQGTMSPFSPMLVEADCVVYAYDRDTANDPALYHDGEIDLANGEVRALRRVDVDYNGSNVGVIEYAVSTDGLKPDCDGDTADYDQFPPQCNDASNWCALSDPAILNITEFALADNSTTVGIAPTQVVLRDIGVTISGQLASSTEFTRTVKSTVRVRSDCFNETITECNAIP
jgi:prepilin-type N-terminal cleavage/methylation domain-containing protein